MATIDLKLAKKAYMSKKWQNPDGTEITSRAV